MTYGGLAGTAQAQVDQIFADSTRTSIGDHPSKSLNPNLQHPPYSDGRCDLERRLRTLKIRHTRLDPLHFHFSRFIFNSTFLSSPSLSHTFLESTHTNPFTHSQTTNEGDPKTVTEVDPEYAMTGRAIIQLTPEGENSIGECACLFFGGDECGCVLLERKYSVTTSSFIIHFNPFQTIYPNFSRDPRLCLLPSRLRLFNDDMI